MNGQKKPDGKQEGDIAIGSRSLGVVVHTNETFGIKCSRCRLDFVVTNPPLEVLNGMTASMLIWTHPEPQSCPECG